MALRTILESELTYLLTRMEMKGCDYSWSGLCLNEGREGQEFREVEFGKFAFEQFDICRS